MALPAAAIAYDAAARSRLDHAVLRIVASGEFRAARVCVNSLWAWQPGRLISQVRAVLEDLRRIFEGFSRALIGADVLYAKRVASRILISTPLWRPRGDMGGGRPFGPGFLFFCGQAARPEGEDARHVSV